MAHDLSEKLSQRAAELGSATYVMGAEVIDGAAEMFLGRLDRARASLEAVLARYDLEEHSDLGPQLTWDPAVAAQAFLSWILWQQGYADQAIATAQDALSLARRLGHPFSIGQALSFLATLHHMLGDPLTALTYAEEAQSVGRGGSYYAWEATGGVARGLALAYADRIEDGVTTIRDSMAVWEHAGAALMTDYFESALAQACLLAGDQPAGLRALDAADGPVEAIWWQPERQRVRARLLLLSPGHQDEAESLLRESLSLSRNLHNHASELRSTLALARLLRDSEQRCEAVRELEKATARFAESDDTPDLRDARRLLAASRVCIDAAPVSV